MFEQATKLKLRFETRRGMASTEDLWDLPLAELDALAIGLQKQVKESAGEVSFITPPEAKDETLQLRFDVAKHVIDVRLKERDEARAAVDRAAKKQQLLEIIARKQTSDLEGKPTEELLAMVAAL